MNIELIPAIDIIDGRCVRLTKGDYTQQVVYNDNPVEQAIKFEEMGIKRLHVVDLDGAKSQHIVNHKVLEQIVANTRLTVDFGGGIKSEDDLRTAFSAGASMVTLGSIAVKQPTLFEYWLHTYGSERIILGADVRNGYISINGWKEDSAEELYAFLDKYIEMGATQVLCTDISRDGTLTGPSLTLYQEVMRRHPNLHLIASGGVSCNEDIMQLEEAGIPAVVFGKAFYEGNIDLSNLM